MGAQRQRRRTGRAGRHRRGRDVLLEHHDSDAAPPQRSRSIPTPTPSALVGIAVLVLIGGGVIHLSGSGSAVPLDEATAPAVHSSAPVGDTEPGAVSESDGAAASVIVHVSGAVEQPGLVELPAGSRVDDAVSAAGGAAADADLAAVNLARPLVDGEQIHIPRPGETPPPAAETGPGSATGGGDNGQINLNTADATGLEQLPGVGPAIAQRIIEHREKNGAFRSVDDLIEVSGIGPATLEKIRDQATV